MDTPTQTEIPSTAEELRASILPSGDWPKLARLLARAIDTVAGLERVTTTQRARIAELERALYDARRSSAA